MHNVGSSSTLCLALVIVPLLASLATSYPASEFEEENPVVELPDKRGWTNFHNGGYGKRGWNSFAGGYGKRSFDYDEDADLADEIQAEKRAWNSGFAGGMGKRAWNSNFNGGMGKRAWNSNFNGGMGKRVWNSGFAGGMGKRAWNSGFAGGMGKRAWNSFNGGYGKRAMELSEGGAAK